MLMFIEDREKVKAIFQELNSKISLTLDLWTSLNGLSILEITSHFIDNDFKLRELLLDAFEMHGHHTGENIANHVYIISMSMSSLRHFDIKGNIFCITTDNASNNRTMAREIQKHLPDFTEKENLLGFAGHVINLAAVAGLKPLGHQEKDHFLENDKDGCNNDVEKDGWGDDDPEETDHENFDPKSIFNRLMNIIKEI
jgi:hypothetical protein